MDQLDRPLHVRHLRRRCRCRRRWPVRKHRHRPGRSDGAKASAIRIAQRGALIEMQGQTVFRWATTIMGGVALEACRRAGVAPKDIKVAVPHQANLRIVEAIVRRLGATEAVVARDIIDSGNTSAASVPLALSRLVEKGDARTGDPALVLAFGSGLTFAGQVITCP
jgi:3-oxoacyl-[acyl-carrier-protein] synthase-3